MLFLYFQRRINRPARDFCITAQAIAESRQGAVPAAVALVLMGLVTLNSAALYHETPRARPKCRAAY